MSERWFFYPDAKSPGGLREGSPELGIDGHRVASASRNPEVLEPVDYPLRECGEVCVRVLTRHVSGLAQWVEPRPTPEFRTNRDILAAILRTDIEVHSDFSFHLRAPRKTPTSGRRPRDAGASRRRSGPRPAPGQQGAASRVALARWSGLKATSIAPAPLGEKRRHGERLSHLL
jgi:hypothetical protein